MAITLSEASEMLSLVTVAYKECLKNQSYTIKDRTYTRADLEVLRKERKYWQEVVGNLESGGAIGVKRVLIRDR